MSASNTVSPSTIRARFATAMSDMYRREVPQYGTLLKLVADVNTETLADHPELEADLAAGGELDRLSVERHGAIRVGTPAELRTLARLFAVMGMAPVGYYDLAEAGVPVHATAFRPTDPNALATHPFRLFTSLLRLDLIADADLRRRAATILAGRDIFRPRARELIGRFETAGGLTDAEADAFVAEAIETFRWHEDATVDYATYSALAAEHRLIADVVCFRGPHINHLTPRTLDIDAAQAAMPRYGIAPKAFIEGPPKRDVPILLRQTSFKALEESIRFAGDTGGRHTARFGEIEQRGVALTRDGRARYDRLLAGARAEASVSGDDYQAVLARHFSDFPDDLESLRRRGLAHVRYTAATPRAPVPELPADDKQALETLLAAGHIIARPLVYEDFLPVSAAGIFQSNLGGDDKPRLGGAQARQADLETALGRSILDPFDLYAAIETNSAERAVADCRARCG